MKPFADSRMWREHASAFMHELRVFFRIDRFLNRTADYENILSMQGMLALAMRGTSTCSARMRRVRGAASPEVARAFAESVHAGWMHGIGYSRIRRSFSYCSFSERTSEYENPVRMQARLAVPPGARPALREFRVYFLNARFLNASDYEIFCEYKSCWQSLRASGRFRANTVCVFEMLGS
jgi:hypothetical protein